MKYHKRKVFICLLAFGLILWSVISYIDYLSVKTRNDITNNEFKEISREFNLKISQENMTYIYYQGSERFGVKIHLDEYSVQCIDGVLDIDTDISPLQEYLSNDDFYEYKTSSGNYVFSKVISYHFDSQRFSEF